MNGGLLLYINDTGAGAVFAPALLLSHVFTPPIKSPICFNKLEHKRDERECRRRASAHASFSVCLSFSLLFSVFLILPFLSRSFASFGPSRLDVRHTNENGMNAITSRHCRLFCARYYLAVFARVVLIVVFVVFFRCARCRQALSFSRSRFVVCSLVFISTDDYFDDAF